MSYMVSLRSVGIDATKLQNCPSVLHGRSTNDWPASVLRTAQWKRTIAEKSRVAPQHT